MKNFIPTKGVGLRRMIDRKFQTITTSEAYTSRRCYECGYDLRSYKADIDSQWSSKRQENHIKSGQEIHRLRVCEGCMKVMNQDVGVVENEFPFEIIALIQAM